MNGFQVNAQKIIFILLIAMLAFNSGIMDDPVDWLRNLMLIVPGIIIGLSFHEFAHAFVAYKLGDQTPKAQGRVTINPGAHIDPIGLVALAFIGFGWGKPVQVNPRAFKNPRRDEALVSIAGVTMNLILAIVFTGIFALYINLAGAYIFTTMGEIIYTILLYVIQINVVLMVFNLLPIPPLDGYNLIGEIFNLKRKGWYWQIYNYGTFILLAAILLGLTSRILVPIVNSIMNFLLGIVI